MSGSTKVPRKFSPARLRLSRAPLLFLGLAALAMGVWGGLVRLPLALPIPADNANWITYHGPLMVCGFLGTVIALERAVGLGHLWTYGAPLLTGAGALAIAAGVVGPHPLLAITLGSAWSTAAALAVIRLQRSLFTSVMALGAAAWLVGNVLWFLGWEIPRVVPWWIAFLAFTIVGERLDLSRFQKPVPSARPLFLAALGLFGVGLVLVTLFPAHGGRICALGLVALAGWLARFDIARRTLRQPGLPRFMAFCLLSGYVWLALSGVLWCVFSPLQPGLHQDAILHAFFVGFVFSMIFGHAPVIFPAILHLPSAFRGRFYLHVALLHLSLAVRLTGDLASLPTVRVTGAVLNACAVALFFLNTASVMLPALLQRPATRSTPTPGR
jgi:hypothetical protein